MIPIKFSDLNYWSCSFFREARKFTKEDYISFTGDFIVFIHPETKHYFLTSRGDAARVFFLNNLAPFDPFKELKSRDYLIFNIEDDLSVLPYVGHKEVFALLIGKTGEPCGVLMDVQNIYELHYEMQSGFYRRNLQLDFKNSIINNIQEEIFITDEYGFVQFLNPYAEEVCGVKLEDVIGMHVDDLEKNGIISSSISKEVYRTKKMANQLMDLQTGETVLATGIPMFDSNGNLKNVLSTSKNLESMRNVMAKMNQLSNELNEKQERIAELQKKVIEQENYVIESPAMKKVESLIYKVAPTNATVLIEGESGTGKGVIAELIHKLSNRSDKPFLKVNCAMIPEHLLESEFFGYEPGSFTGANRSGKKGKFELADGGTIFLDEIGEMPLILQAKILEFLQDREIIRVGGVKRIAVDVRIIVATNRDLRDMVAKQQFRNDLFYRLNVMPIFLEPLRNRTEDILPLCRLFLHKYNIRFAKSKSFAPEAIAFFLKYSWPGNVRELMHTVERLIITSDSDVISLEEAKKVANGIIEDAEEVEERLPEIAITSLKHAKHELEFALVKKGYDTFHSSYKVAEALGISQAAVMKILKRNGYRLKNGSLEKTD